MQVFARGYKGVSLLLSLNKDRIYSAAALAGSLLLAAWLVSH